jgi:hypothetical protein
MFCRSSPGFVTGVFCFQEWSGRRERKERRDEKVIPVLCDLCVLCGHSCLSFDASDLFEICDLRFGI